jgi:ankyrin repeat protein
VLLAGREADFYEACALGYRDRAAALLHADAKLADSFSADGFPALGLAVFFGHAELAEMLVEAGADVNLPSRNAFHVYPLHSAVASGNVALVELLLRYGAKADPEEFLGATPLHSAAAGGNRKMVQKLLAAGADRNRKTNDGKTAADLARQHGHAELAEEIEK